MFFNTDKESKAQVSTAQAFRHMLIFQIKLAADALRDLILSPVSILVFIADALRKPALEDSWYLRLMLLGRKSDRLINLFDEHKNAGQYTVDRAVHEVENVVRGSKGDTKE
jgi:hypothetical protein